MRTSNAFAVLVTLLLSSSPLVAQGQRDDATVFINSIAFGNIAAETCGFGSPPPEVTTLAPGQTQPPGVTTTAAPGQTTQKATTLEPGATPPPEGTGSETPASTTTSTSTGTTTTSASAEGSATTSTSAGSSTTSTTGTTTTSTTGTTTTSSEDTSTSAEDATTKRFGGGGIPRRLRTRNTDGPTAIHVEVASGAAVTSGVYTLHAVTGGAEHPSYTVEITSGYLFHTEFIYHKFDIETGDSIAQGCVYLNRTRSDSETQDVETISCVAWGADSVCPCLDPTGITGEVADGNLWALQLPPVEGGAVPFLGGEQGDYIPGVDNVEATVDNCKFGQANVGQSFAGDNNSTAMINEVILGVACHAAHAVYNETSAYTGIEVAAFQPAATPVELLLVVEDHNDIQGSTLISTADAGTWNFVYVDMPSFTSSDEQFGEDLSSGAVLLFSATDFTLLSSISWGKSGGVTINWDALDGAPAIGPRTYYPLLVSEAEQSASYFSLTGSMAVMKDGVWGVVATDDHCTPGEVNEGQTPPTTDTTVAPGPPGGARKATVTGICTSALAFAVLSHW